MNTKELFQVIFLALLFNSVILSLIISFATKTGKKMKHMKAQTLLLIQIALKQGVDPETLKKIMDSTRHKKVIK